MGDEKAILRGMLPNSWMRDRTSPGQVYVPEAIAPPARGVEGFELRADGTYTEIVSGPTDAPEEREGTWDLSADNVLTLLPGGVGRKARKMRLLELTETRMVSEE